MATKTKRIRPPGNGAAPPATLCCAIYTRQSVADDKEFGSLEAQREAVENYIRSQPGWTILPERYDDAGFSGGTIERPAFRKLMSDIEVGGIDAVAVYKLDRLSRSINDFVRITDFFERHGVRFISTTQAFDTSTSVGRMTVNLLATFATFEREMISERTRDKMGAARRRGMWCGGQPALGYDLKKKKLVPNAEEADRVRMIFDLYLKLGSVLAVAQDLNRRGWRTKARKRNGAVLPGRPFDKQSVTNILRNVGYRGKVQYAGEIFDGAHEALVDQATWDRVQHQLRENGKRGRSHHRGPGRSGALLLGLARCACGSGMTAHSAMKGNRRYVSYVCQRYQKEGAASCPGSRVSLADLEAFVLDEIRAIGRDPAVLRETIAAARGAAETRKPGLVEELENLERRERELEVERRNLLDALAQSGTRSSGLLEKLGGVETELVQVSRRVGEARAEIAVLENHVFDEDDLRRAIESFEPVWGQLFPAERARILQLLIETVTYDAREGEVEIRFRASGIRVLAAEREEKGTA